MRLILLIAGCLGFLAIPRIVRPPTPVYSAGVQSAITWFQAGSRSFAASCTDLRQSIAALQPNDPASIAAARHTLLTCRVEYKKIESFLEYFFRSSSTIYNRPPKYEAEEPDMEYQSPVGLQVIEAILYDKHPNRKALLEQAKAVESAAADLPALLYDLHASDSQLLESLRVELIRIMALDITGYEAPLLQSGIHESAAALRSLSFQLQPYLQAGDPRSDSLHYFLDKAIAMTDTSRSFDAFDRLTFLTNAALPLQRQLSRFIREKKLEQNTNKVLNDDADDIFSPNAFRMDHFGGNSGNTRDFLLGRQLFYNPSLSGNGQKSCASCHDPSKAFTDHVTRSVAFDGHSLLDRNAPSLLYCSYQYNQFWDGRVHSLEEQIRTVFHNPREMNADTIAMQRKTGLTTQQIVTAIAAYVRSLHPMNSPFDRYMQGDTTTLTARQKHGANLFMGKAQCATCHFIPLFNGLIPPDYTLTEYEVLGTTRTDRLDQPQLSTDPGRYAIYPFPFYKGAFKTPTVRNAAVTYPYMHNGAFQSLKTVLDFYNKGGGAGLGLKVPDQTLSAAPLHLSSREINDIILFIQSLTDTLNQKS